jgi:cyclopropane fatty-acyl-phospholipid synthase-like methyltransferase
LLSEDQHPGPKRIVEAGYDAICERYGKVYAAHHEASELREEYIALLLDRLEPASTVLEIGSGNGVPVAQAIAGRHRVTGVDISSGQVELARRQVPAAAFIKADIMATDFPADSFDAVVSFYAILHIPREEHHTLLHRTYRWLRPGG